MENRNERLLAIGMPEYEHGFWNSMRGKPDGAQALQQGVETGSGGLMLPSTATKTYLKALQKRSIFRRFGTVFNTNGDSKVFVSSDDEASQWIGENQTFGALEVADNPARYEMAAHKLKTLTKLNVDQASDVFFDIESYLVQRFSKRFGRAENDAFINGNGVTEPKGILHSSLGAQTGITASSPTELTFDEVIALYFSVDKEYREDGVWLMNDSTALALKMLKDSSGYPLWNQNSGTILEKEAIICNDMPDIASGAKPIAFGDLSNYWICASSPLSVKVLGEKYILNQKIGYVGTEFVDGRLIRQDAIKVIKMATAE